MPIVMNKAARVAIAASLGLAAAACQTPANQNASLDSVRQPVVERANYALDVETDQEGRYRMWSAREGIIHVTATGYARLAIPER